jgi:capsular exopolysaccharide synthesis family protein
MQELDSQRVHHPSEVLEARYTYGPYGQETEEVHLRDYWKVLVKHRRLVFLVFLAVVGLTAYITFSATPLYTASATLQIEPQNPMVMKIEEVLTPQAGSSQYDYHQTQFNLLESRTLAARVITDLGLEWKPAFTGKRESDPGLLDWLRSQVSGLLQFGRAHEKEQIREFELGVDPRLINRYLDSLEVKPVRNTRLVGIKFTSLDPRLSQDMANAHATAFIRMNLETRFELTKEAREFLEKKLSELKAKVEKSEEALNRFRQAHGVVSLKGNENIIVERMVDLNQRLTGARAKRIELESLYRIVESKNYQYLSQVIDNNLIQQLKTRLATLETEHARLSTTFTSVHPRLIELSGQINEARQRLDQEIVGIVRGIESDYAAARAREEALQAEAERQQQAALNLKEQGAEYTILEGEVESNRTLYDSVLKRANETNVSGDVAVSNIQITDRAETPLSPSSPRTQRNLLLATAVGLFFGIGLAFFLEYLDSTLKTPQDVWRAVFVPTLGVVPHLSSLRHRAYGYGRLPKHSSTRRLVHPRVAADQSFSRELMVSHHPFSVISESYRTIRTALLLSQAEKPPQVVLLTSARPGEGKTVATLNLAIALAQSGNAVVVVDADLRKGRCHELLNLQNGRGLTNVLVGSLTLEEGVQQTAVDGLSLLSRGVLPPNPAELLGSRKMREVLNVLRERFAFVLIDSPPVIGISDAVVLSTLCEGVLLVVRGQDTTAVAARQAKEQLETVHARILGVVLNGINIHDPDYANYRYYYASYYTAAQKEADK